MANQANQSTGGTSQDKAGPHKQLQPNQAGQAAQGSHPQGQQQQEAGKQSGQPAPKGHPPGATQRDATRQPSGGSKP